MPAREWVVWDADTAANRPDVAAAVSRFESLPTPAGEAATVWLRDVALANDGSTRTRLLVSDARLEGYFALCAGQVRLDVGEVEALGLPPGRHPMPAILLAWIGRHRDSEVTGRELLAFALGRARRVSREIGAIALALDPRDDAVREVWRAPPYNFRTSARGSGRLWTPLNPAA